MPQHSTPKPSIRSFRHPSALKFLFILGSLFLQGPQAMAENSSHFLLGETVIITEKNASDLPKVIERFNKEGGTLVIDSSVKKGAMPVKPTSKTRIIDLRYPGGINFVRGNHPRLQGIWPQYTGLNTGLGRNLVISDVLPFDAEVESWKGEPIKANPFNAHQSQDSKEYSNSHNHYQNLLSEVWAFSPTVNAVALWGDSGALYPGAKSWGGFLSARSWPVHWKDYVPEGTPGFEDKDFDAQLVGLEVDVLNGGLPYGETSQTIGMPLAKSGIQVVGFGKKNWSAIELRSEDSDDAAKKPEDRRGTWHYGIIAYNSLSEDSTFIYSATPKGKTGLDLSKTDYTDSAIKIKSEGPKTGLAINDYEGGEFFSEKGHLVARMGQQGLRIVTQGGLEVARIDDSGSVNWNGLKVSYFPYSLIPIAMLAMLIVTIVLSLKMSRQFKAMKAMMKTATIPS